MYIIPCSSRYVSEWAISRITPKLEFLEILKPHSGSFEESSSEESPSPEGEIIPSHLWFFKVNSFFEKTRSSTNHRFVSWTRSHSRSWSGGSCRRNVSGSRGGPDRWRLFSGNRHRTRWWRSCCSDGRGFGNTASPRNTTTELTPFSWGTEGSFESWMRSNNSTEGRLSTPHHVADSVIMVLSWSHLKWTIHISW